MSKKKTFVQLEIEKPLFRSTVSWENVEDDDSICLDPEVIARIRSELPSLPRAVRTQVDVSKVPERGPFAVRVSNLAFTVTRSEVEGFFEHLRPSKVVLSTNYDNVSDRSRPLNRGWAILEFASRKDIIQALELNGRSINNRSVRIELHTRDNSRQTNFQDDRSSRAMESNDVTNDRSFFNRPMNRPMRQIPPQTRLVVLKDPASDENWRRRDPLPTTEKAVSNRAPFVWSARQNAPPADSGEMRAMNKYSIEPMVTERVESVRRPPLLRPPPLNPPERRSHVNFGERVQVARYNSIFGAAKPVDTFHKEMQIHQKWEEQRRMYLKNAPFPQTNRRVPWNRSNSAPQSLVKDRPAQTAAPIPTSEAQHVRKAIAPPPAVNFWEVRKRSLNIISQAPSSPPVFKAAFKEQSHSVNRPQPSKPIETPRRTPLRIIPQITPINYKTKPLQSVQQSPAQQQPVKIVEKPSPVKEVKRFTMPTISYSAILRSAPKMNQPVVSVSLPSPNIPPAIVSKPPQPQTPSKLPPKPPTTTPTISNVNSLTKQSPLDNKTKEKPFKVLTTHRNKKKIAILKDDWSDEENISPSPVIKVEEHPVEPPAHPRPLFQAEENVFHALPSECTENVDPLMLSQANESVVTATLISQAHENTVSCLFSPAKKINFTSSVSHDKENTMSAFIEPPHWKEFIPSYILDRTPVPVPDTSHYLKNNFMAPVHPVKSHVITERRKHVAPLLSQNRQNIVRSHVTQRVENQQMEQENIERFKSIRESVLAAQSGPVVKNRMRAVVSYKLGLLLSETGEPIGPAVPDYPGQKNISCSTIQDRRFRQSSRASSVREVSGANNSADKQNRKRRFPNRSPRPANNSLNLQGEEKTDKSTFEPFINVFPQGGWTDTDFPPMCDPHLFISENLNKPPTIMEESFNKWDEFSQNSRKDRKGVSFVS